MNVESGPGMTDTRLLLLLQMNDALHALSQPLTSITFAVELAADNENALERGEMLRSAKIECARAMANVATLREHMAQLMGLTKFSKKEMA